MRIRAKKDTILNQEAVIRSLAREVKIQQMQGCDQNAVRNKLIQMTEKELERDELQNLQTSNAPQIERSKERHADLRKLQYEQQSIQEEIGDVQRELNALERPATAVRRGLENTDGDAKSNWMRQKDLKFMELKQTESKAFNLQREIRHQAKMHAAEVSQLKLQL